MIFKSLAVLIDVGIVLWVQFYGWAYLLGINGPPSERVTTLFLILAVLLAGGSNLRLRTGNFVPGNKKEIA